MSENNRDREFLEILKTRLKPERLYHSICVAEQARHLAEKFGYDSQKAYTAGLVHDIMRYEPIDKMIEMIEADGQALTDSEKKMTVTLHAIAGEIFLRKELGVTDNELLSAVRYHTTGKEDMSLLEKIIYVADLTSEDRQYPDILEVREMAEVSLEKTCLRGLSFTLEDNARKCRPIHIDTLKAYNFLLERMQNNG